MKSTLKLFIILIFIGCKNDIYSDFDKLISSENGDTKIIYKNSYKNGAVKDSITGVLFDQAQVYSSKGKSRNAIKLYKKALKLEPNNIYIINVLGNSYNSLRLFKKASEYFERAIELDSEFPDTYLNYGFSKANNKEYRKAIELYNLGVGFQRSGEKKAYFYDNLSRAHYNLYEDDKAKLYNKKALELVNNEFIKNEIMNFRKTLYEK
ncbi:tetratricopeptide repeat protein [Lacinutrix sp. MEBiC02404]